MYIIIISLGLLILLIASIIITVPTKNIQITITDLSTNKKIEMSKIQIHVGQTKKYKVGATNEDGSAGVLQAGTIKLTVLANDYADVVQDATDESILVVTAKAVTVSDSLPTAAVTGDADLGDGVDTLTTTLSIEVLAKDAVAITITEIV